MNESKRQDCAIPGCGRLAIAGGRYCIKDTGMCVDEEKAQNAMIVVCQYLGIDTGEEDMIATPKRFLRGMREMLTDVKPVDALGTTFELVAPSAHTLEFVAQADIRFTALCRHHMLPFFGWADIAYLPSLEEVNQVLENGFNKRVTKRRVFGLSKLPRLVVACAKDGLQMQESITAAIARHMTEHPCAPQGVRVIVRARHGCMSCRGVQQSVITATSASTGCVATSEEMLQRAERAISFSRPPSGSRRA